MEAWDTILNFLKSISDKLDTLLKQKVVTKSIVRSDEINELVAALSLAQKEYKPITLSLENSFTQISFASLTQVVEATREALCKNALSVLQVIFDHEDGTSILHTLLTHSSGQFIESQMRLKPKNVDPTAVTSYVNWAKRTAYSAITCCPIPNEDDDAVEYQESTGEAPINTNGKSRRSKGYEVISSFQREELERELEGFDELRRQILETYTIKTIADLPKEKYEIVIDKVRVLKHKLKN